MAQLARVTCIQFGVNVNAASDVCEFGTPATGSPVYTSNIATLQANTAWTTGWAAETVASNRPFLEDMNASHIVFSYMLCYLFQTGVPAYDSGTTYYQYSIVQYGGLVWQSLTNSNIGNTPVQGTNWIPLIGLQPNQYLSFTAQSSINFTGLVPGQKYKLIINYLQNTAGGTPYVQFNGDSGTNYLYYNNIANASTVVTNGGASQTYGAICASIPSAGTGIFELTFESIQGNNNGAMFTGNGIGSMSGTSNFGGKYTGSAPLSSVQIGVTAGTFTGTAELLQIN